jgi:hypothetical protein
MVLTMPVPTDGTPNGWQGGNAGSAEIPNPMMATLWSPALTKIRGPGSGEFGDRPQLRLSPRDMPSSANRDFPIGIRYVRNTIGPPASRRQRGFAHETGSRSARGDSIGLCGYWSLKDWLWPIGDRATGP